MTLAGSIVLIILPPGNSSISFIWDSAQAEEVDSVAIITDYVNTVGEGKLAWHPRRRQEKLWWIYASGQTSEGALKYKTEADLNSCDVRDPCTYLSFQVFQVNREGYLEEITR